VEGWEQVRREPAERYLLPLLCSHYCPKPPTVYTSHNVDATSLNATSRTILSTFDHVESCFDKVERCFDIVAVFGNSV